MKILATIILIGTVALGAVEGDCTANLSQKGNRQMRICRFFKDGKCQRPEGERK